MDIKQYIRGIIKEQIDVLLNEDYEGTKEIRQFSNEILKTIAEEYYNSIIERHGDMKNIKIMSVSIKYVARKTKKSFDKIKDFINSTNVTCIITPKYDKDKIKGYYTSHDLPYDPEYYKDIVVYYDKDLEDDLKNKIEQIHQYGHNPSTIDIYTTLYYKLFQTLVHEVQHAYDDYRSKGKIYQTKQNKNYIEKYADKMEYDTKEEELKAAKKYLRLPHEVWARFTQAIDKIRFSTGYFKKLEDGRECFLSEMNPIIDVVKDFKYKFNGWNSLENKPGELSNMQKRLLKAVVQFWHKEKIRIEQENKNLTFCT